jgi:DNA-binding NarL/FixJ family response regulator
MSVFARKPAIRALVADDHAIVRRGLKDLLAESGDIVVEGEAATAGEVLEEVRKRPYDVLVLDLNLPDRSGLDLLDELRRDRPDLPVLVLTMAAEEHFAARALRAGAAGYVTKGVAPEEVVHAIRKVTQGGRYVSPAAAERLASMLGPGVEQPPHERLSPREFQVFRILASGRTVSQAADELCVNVKTVSTYRARILEKMNLESNAELALYAVRNRLIE